MFTEVVLLLTFRDHCTITTHLPHQTPICQPFFCYWQVDIMPYADPNAQFLELHALKVFTTRCKHLSQLMKVVTLLCQVFMFMTTSKKWLFQIWNLKHCVKTLHFLLNDAMFWTMFFNFQRCNDLTMFQKNAKHRANDASNDVHRPPLIADHNHFNEKSIVWIAPQAYYCDDDEIKAWWITITTSKI